ncbi:MAG: GHKL domain-containing protein [Chitinophagaceae bacterium]|nr:MAG: GHKL domain-containing protein [Chitinophagaceae bacterium]
MRIENEYFFTKPDTARVIAEKALALSRELRYVRGVVTNLNELAEATRFLGNYPLALKLNFEALQMNREMKDINGEARTMAFIGLDYIEFREYHLGLEYLLSAIRLDKEMHNQLRETFSLTNAANAYDLLKMPDSALYYSKLAYKTYTGLNHGPLKSLILTRMGNAYVALGKKDSALTYYQMALANSMNVNEKVNLSKIQRKIAEVFELTRQYDSSLYYARQSFLNGELLIQRFELLETSELLTRLFYQRKNMDSAFYYQDVAKAMTDSLYGPQKFKELQLLMLEEQQRQQEIQREQERYKNNTKMVGLWSAIGVFFIIAFLLYRNNRHKQKANALLQSQKEKIQNTLSELKATQSQLIQSEKMASLGELTAGIAHEIQNPLNFVNNFSEVNGELIRELKEEVIKGNLEEVSAIANDIESNSEKINHHGKRADAIVKGMLQHSRSSSGIKEPTDINALADEYLRLSYHGLRARDKSFNATMKTDFDETIGNINIIPQDIGRVVLNLINNAFYVVDEKKKQNQHGYEPIVSVSTKKSNGTVEIKVKDNGNGIPQKVLDKIFHPFFTTKPTGQGTGLGLSLSYDIVKAHGGELKVETKEGEGSEFIIQLPGN